MKSFTDIVVETLKIPVGSIRPELTPADVPGWDSMNYLLFISELEETYNISFSMDEVLGMKNLGDVMQALRKKNVTL